MSRKPLEWVEFRKKLGETLQSRLHRVSGAAPKRFLQKMINYVLDVDYEGPPICGGEMTSLHTVYEDIYLYEFKEYQTDWEDFEQHDAIHDWLIDSHPGLCPQNIVEGVEELW